MELAMGPAQSMDGVDPMNALPLLLLPSSPKDKSQGISIVLIHVECNENLAFANPYLYTTCVFKITLENRRQIAKYNPKTSAK